MGISAEKGCKIDDWETEALIRGVCEKDCFIYPNQLKAEKRLLCVGRTVHVNSREKKIKTYSGKLHKAVRF